MSYSMKIRPVGAELFHADGRTDGRTDGHDDANSLSPQLCERYLKIVHSAHTVFMCFVCISEQTATCATYIINWLVEKYFLRGTNWVFK